ncbi:MAG: SDR family NAD(P)-dependent oxidoreductase [Myxococcota bacterium]
MGHSRIFRDDLFADRVVLVTGGGTGIGVAVARELGSLGAKVVIASRKAENIEPAARCRTGREVVSRIRRHPRPRRRRPARGGRLESATGASTCW